MEKFMLATKKKLRFATAKGNLSTEDLWDLTLEQLDSLCVILADKLEKTVKKSFLNTPKDNSHNQLRFDIAKAILEAKVEEREASKTRSERMQKRAEIEAIIASKERAAQEDKSIEELKKELEALND